MFTLLSGPFFPHLEAALVETVQQVKTADSRTPLAIIVPSDSLRRRVQWLLCAEHSCALFDVHILTFHQFALHLHAERRSVNPADAGEPALELVSDFFYEYLLTVLLEQGGEPAEPFAHLKNSSGLRQALWRSLRDLQEAQVEPALVLQAVQEGLFDEMATHRLQGLLKFQTALTLWSRQFHVGLPEDLADSILPWVPCSPWLAGLATIIYYGFYDITQVQLSLLEEVARHASVRVFFPLADHPSYRFARRFLDRYLLKAGVHHSAAQMTHACSPRWHRPQGSPEVQVVNTIGEQGELSFTCKAILQAVEKTGHAFFDIGVVARNLELYRPFLRRIFDEHCIPFRTTATVPLLEEPAAKVWWQLAGLKEDQYSWRMLLDLIASPYYHIPFDSRRSNHEQGHLWRQAVRFMRIVRGRDDWERLLRASKDTTILRDWQRQHGLSEEEATAAVQQLAAVVEHLIADCETLPESGSIGDLTYAFESLTHRHLDFSVTLPPSLSDERDKNRLMNVTQGIEQVLALLKQVDRIGIPITWAEWRALFVRALETVRIPVAGQCPVGVQVIDAMAARGHAFHILFLLGMNEQVFPRVVREDAFLRDSDRRVLAESLGYKIDEKMNGFDEEALLFTLLRQSARDRVYLLYQRADHKGRLLLPSSLLLESREQSEACSAPEISVPLRMADCVTLPSYSARGETLQEMRVHYLLQGQEIHADPSERSGWWEILHSGLKAIASLERRFLSAGPFDGIVPGEGPHWRELMSRGLSPTALEQYVQCPFKYWMEQVLGTRNDREPLSRELPNRVWGELGHAIFRRVYQNLIDEGWPVLRLEPVPLSSFLNSAIEQVADEYAMRYGKGYVLLWERIKLQFLRVLMAMVEHDQQEYEALGMRPVAFEIEAEGEIPSGVPGTSPGIKIRGRLDRVDRQVKESRTRIVDYKFSAGLALGTAEPDLLNDALQGRRLQPPFYSFLSCPSPASDSGEEALAHPSIQSIEFRYIRPLNGDALGFSSFASAHWETSAGNQLLSTIHRWIQGLRGGQFFVLPGSYCRGCHWSVACRVQHHPSWMRAYALPLAKDFRQLRKQRKTDE